MPDIQMPAAHPVFPTAKTGVLLVNLGTPDGHDYWSMRRYLHEFLSDRRVIDANPFIWKLILNLVILSIRPFKSGHAYKTVWNNELNESPFLTITRAQTDEVRRQMSARFPNTVYEFAMRYGNPSIESGLMKLKDQGCQKILIFALYPQYAGASSATVYDKAFDVLKQMKWQPAIRTVPTYHDHPVYIDALKQSIDTHLSTLDFAPDMILTSFHGLPKRYLLEGDPYHCFCAKTSRLLREHMNWPQEKWQLTFQSRFGAEEWLQPYTDKTVEALAKSGVKNLALIAPCFVADCLETLEELNIGIRKTFLENGGENFAYIPCLNDTPPGIWVLNTVIENELQGWL